MKKFKDHQKYSNSIKILPILILSLAVFLNPITGELYAPFSFAKIAVPTTFLLILWLQNGKLLLPENTLSFLLFIVLSTTSFFLGDNFFLIYISFFGYFILLLVVSNIVNNDGDIFIVLSFYFWGVFLIALLCCFDYIFPEFMDKITDKNLVEYWWGHQTVFLAFENNPNGFATCLGPAVVISFPLILRQKVQVLKFLYFFMGILIFFVLVMTHSRSALLGTFVALSILLYFYFAKYVRWSVIFNTLILVFLVTFLTLAFWSSVYPTSELSDTVLTEKRIQDFKQTSVVHRLKTFPYIFQVAMENPLTGIGFGNGKEHIKKLSGISMGAHNIFLGIMIEFGIFAMLAFLISAIGPFLRLHFNLVARRSRTNIHLASISVYGGFLAILIHGMFHEIYVNFLFWLFVALVCANNKNTAHQREKSRAI